MRPTGDSADHNQLGLARYRTTGNRSVSREKRGWPHGCQKLAYQSREGAILDRPSSSLADMYNRPHFHRRTASKTAEHVASRKLVISGFAGWAVSSTLIVRGVFKPRLRRLLLFQLQACSCLSFRLFVDHPTTSGLDPLMWTEDSSNLLNQGQ